MARGKPEMTDDVKTYVVQAIACFDPPSVVVAAVQKEFAVTITRQNVEAYDPTKVSGARLGKRWVELFNTTRKTFLEDTSSIAVSHRAVRLRALQRMADKAEGMGAIALAAQLYEQAAKESGDAYTNRQRMELTGAGGGPIQQQVVDRPPPETRDEWLARRRLELASPQ